MKTKGFWYSVSCLWEYRREFPEWFMIGFRQKIPLRRMVPKWIGYRIAKRQHLRSHSGDTLPMLFDCEYFNCRSEGRGHE